MAEGAVARRGSIRAGGSVSLVAGFALGAIVADPVLAQTAEAAGGGMPLIPGDDGTLTTRAVQLLVLITVLSLVPGLAIMVTCFPFLVTVFAILRQAIGLPQSPPNMLIVSLALFLTWFVMEPVFLAAWEGGIVPLMAGEMTPEAGFAAVMEPFRVFMGATMRRWRPFATCGPICPKARIPCRCWSRRFSCPRSRGRSRSAS